MFKTFKQSYLTSILYHSQQFLVTKSSLFDLAKQMKLLNEKKQFRKALDLFHQYEQTNVDLICNLSITQALKACAQIKDLNRGVSIETKFSSRLANDIYILNTLIHLHMCCGNVKHAEELFLLSKNKSLSTYGAMMKGYMTNQLSKKAIDLFEEIEKADEIVTTIFFSACAQSGTDEQLQLIKRVASTIPNGFYRNPQLLCSLIDAYMQCGDVKSAELVFDKSSNKNLYIYATMMKGYIANEMSDKAISLFAKVQKPDVVIVICLFNACAQLGTKESLDLTKTVASTIPNGFYRNPQLLCSLIDAYMKCGDLSSAELIFDQTSTKNLYIYGAMMKGYIVNEMSDKAIDLFSNVQNPDAVLVILLFNACAQSRTKTSLDLTKKVASTIPNGFYQNHRLLYSLMDAYMKCGDVRSAESIFDKSSDKSLNIYGAMMNGYIANEMSDKAIDLFSQIQNPDDVTVILLLNACAQSRTNERLELIRKVASTIPKDFYQNHRLICSLIDAYMKCDDVKNTELVFENVTKKNLYIYGAMMKGTNEQLELIRKVASIIPNDFYQNHRLICSLMDAYMQCGDVKNAELVFDKVPTKELHDYGAMMKGYIKNNMAEKATNLFSKISDPDDVIFILLFNASAQLATNEQLESIRKVASIIPNDFYQNHRLICSLMNAYIKCGDVKSAESVFNKASNKDSDIYGTMMNGYIQNEMSDKTNYEKVLHLFQQMIKKQIQPNIPICLTLIKALTKLGDYDTAKSLIEQIPTDFLTDKRIRNALIHMWGKIGSIDEAQQIFETINDKDNITYGSMINAHGWNGKGTQAVELFYQMPPDLINDIIYICVINACSHSGLLQQARYIFGNIHNKTEIIYNTMVDCLSRAASFDEAKQLVNQFEKDHPPSLAMYMAWLSGARNNKNINVAEKVFHQLQLHFPEITKSSISASVILANIHASSGNMDKALAIRNRINQSGVKKEIGLSWTVVNGQVSYFRAHDRSHPRSNDIYNELEKLAQELLQRGHTFDASWITRSLGENETVISALCGHSEKLAIAANFVLNPQTRRIQVVKNLRVCGDCHSATKLIAAIRQVEIIVRDANRIHHFYPTGVCSCNDYF